jgi:hypothetical protein
MERRAWWRVIEAHPLIASGDGQNPTQWFLNGHNPFTRDPLIYYERTMLAATMNKLIGSAGPYLHMEWIAEKAPRFVWATECSDLIEILVTQLLLVVGSSNPQVICSGCGDLFQPALRRRLNKRAYCPKCGTRAAQRDASRDYRMNLKQKAQQSGADV